MPFSFKKFLNPEAIVDMVNKMPELHTQVIDLVYPASAQENHPFDTIGYADLGPSVKNIPLVSRGGQSFPLAPEDGKLRFIDPANLNPSHFISAADINRLRNMPMISQKVFIEKRIDQLRRSVRKSKEALAIQSLTGKISYDLVQGSDYEKYKVDFGTTASFTPAKKWDASGATPGAIIETIGGMIAKIGEKSDATKFIGFIDAATYAKVCDLFSTTSANLPVRISTDSIVIGNATLYVTSAKYYDYTTKANVPLIAAKKIKIIGVDDGFSFKNCALDSLDASFAGIPFGVREVSLDDPEGIKLIGMARPMPIPNVNAICDATVLT